MSELANIIDRLSVELRITRNHQENLEGITQKKEIDIGEDPSLDIDPILEEDMMITDIGVGDRYDRSNSRERCDRYKTEYRSNS